MLRAMLKNSSEIFSIVLIAAWICIRINSKFHVMIQINHFLRVNFGNWRAELSLNQ